MQILKKPLDITAIVLDTKIYIVSVRKCRSDGFQIFIPCCERYQSGWTDISHMEGRIGISGEVNAFFV